MSHEIDQLEFQKKNVFVLRSLLLKKIAECNFHINFRRYNMFIILILTLSLKPDNIWPNTKKITFKFVQMKSLAMLLLIKNIVLICLR